MTEIKIMSIQNLLRIPHLKSSYEHAIIFITTNPEYYDFGCTNFYQFNIADTDAPVVTDSIVRQLRCIIKSGYGTIYVCCDAGLSRSPAIALFVAQISGDYHQGNDIIKKYRFMNMSLYNKLMEIFK